MSSVERGEVWRVRHWQFLGHEPTGDRPVLVVSPSRFNTVNERRSQNRAIVVPLTSRGHDCETWWETTIGATGSTALPADVRTVRVADLSRRQCRTATELELENVLTIINTLILDEGEEDQSEFRRGDVWNVKLSDGNQAEVLVLHSNASNAMAMTMATTSKRRKRSGVVLPIESNTSLPGYSVLVSQVRSLSTECRFLDRVGRITARQVDEAGKMLIRLLSPVADT